MFAKFSIFFRSPTPSRNITSGQMLNSRREFSGFLQAKPNSNSLSTRTQKDPLVTLLETPAKEKACRYISDANMFAKQKNYPTAALNFELGIAIDPNAINPLINYAQMLYHIGHYSKAAELYRKVRELDPNNEFAKYGLEKIEGKETKLSNYKSLKLKN